MNPKKLNNILLIITILSLLASIIGLIKFEYWLLCITFISINIVLLSILLDRRENLRKGWRV